MADGKILSEPDSAVLKRLVQKEVRRELASRGLTRDDPESTQDQDIYIAKVPDASNFIPARAGATAGFLECDIIKIDQEDASLDALTGIKRKVYNPYLIKLYKAAQPYFAISRTKHGAWICEKPRMWHKAVVSGADIDINSSGTVALSFNGATSALTETAWLNWMHGDQKVSDGLEVVIYFFEDENKWIILNAECEVII